jgi:hypothetical protein
LVNGLALANNKRLPIQSTHLLTPCDNRGPIVARPTEAKGSRAEEERIFREAASAAQGPDMGSSRRQSRNDKQTKVPDGITMAQPNSTKRGKKVKSFRNRPSNYCQSPANGCLALPRIKRRTSSEEVARRIAHPTSASRSMATRLPEAHPREGLSASPGLTGFVQCAMRDARCADKKIPTALFLLSFGMSYVIVLSVCLFSSL